MRNKILTYLLSTSPTKSLLIIEGKRVTWQRRNSADIILIKWPKWVSPVSRQAMCLLTWRTGEGTPFYPWGACSKRTAADESQEDIKQIQTQGHDAPWLVSSICLKYQGFRGKWSVRSEQSEAETKETWQLNPTERPGSEKGCQRDNQWRLNRNCRLVNRMVECAFPSFENGLVI